MPILLAQSESIWPSVIQALSNNGFWVFVGICVLAATAKNIVTAVLKHRERIAMIEAGMTPPGEQSPEAGETLAYERPEQPRHRA